MNIFLFSSFIFCGYLALFPCLPAATAAQSSAMKADCPASVYKGKIELTFIREDVGPINELIDNMFFFYGMKPDQPPQGNHALHLKTLMKCSDGGEGINTAITHFGIYTFLDKKCTIRLNGNGRIRNTRLVERGQVKLSCKDKSIFRGNYLIIAQEVSTTEQKKDKGAGNKSSSSNENASSSSNSWNPPVTKPEQEDGETGPNLPASPKL
ncbi:MAG: hypothetical protein D3909_16570 [Candidatus Electrothrix sp. ATG1]|nr:hypothetical protein [Candidatus Electrothrix sp. ATG1]